jgi:starch synthase
MSHSFKVIFAAAEVTPLVKAGGLGDVAGSLPRALRRAGHDVRIVMPRYGITNLEGYQAIFQGSFSIPFMGGQEDVAIVQVSLKDMTPVYLVENERYFNRAAIYGEADDLERFLLFSLAVMEVPKKFDWQPDIMHCHDWHTGVIPPLLKVTYRNDAFYSSCASVFTIHNLAYQGWFDDFFAERAGLYEYLLSPDDPMRSKTYSMTGLGICHADIVSTVSETYAREILTPEYGESLETLLQRRNDSLYGILNGVDYEHFNPATDPVIAVNYDVNGIDRRPVNKLALQEKAKLPLNKEIPLIGMAGRLVDQKGPDILLEALERLLSDTDVQFVLQGTGDSKYQERLEGLENLYPDKTRMFLTLDFSLAQLIFAGCDIFVVPSRFEPCGLTPLIAMRYGAIPIVRRTGGLAETVRDYNSDLSSGLGFVFENCNATELLAALRRALAAFQKKKEWRNLMMRAMKADFSWNSSLPKYEALYETARHKIMD